MWEQIPANGFPNTSGLLETARGSLLAWARSYELLFHRLFCPWTVEGLPFQQRHLSEQSLVKGKAFGRAFEKAGESLAWGSSDQISPRETRTIPPIVFERWGASRAKVFAICQHGWSCFGFTNGVSIAPKQNSRSRVCCPFHTQNYNVHIAPVPNKAHGRKYVLLPDPALLRNAESAGRSRPRA